jgi:putative ABC transport system ATP-binding protein
MDQAITQCSESLMARIRQRYVGYVFQAFRLFRALSALENVSLSLELSGCPKNEARQRAEASLEQLGLYGKRHLLPKELSGGEKQKVAIARALVCDPPIILADEPTASLDSNAGEQIANILRDLASKESRLVVVVSHDGRWRDYCNRTLLMSDGRLVGEEQFS